MRRIILAATILAVVVPMLPASAQVTAGDVEAARQELQAVSAALNDQMTEYNAAVAREAVLRDRLDRMLVELANRERELGLARTKALHRAVEMYMGGGAARSGWVSSDDLGALPARLVYLDSVALTDREVVNSLEMTRWDYEQQRDLVNEAIAEQEELLEEMDLLIGEILAELEVANDQYQAVKTVWDAQEAERIRLEEEERARQAFLATSTTTIAGAAPAPPTEAPVVVPAAPAAPAQPPGTRVCPVDGAHSFTDTWGEPRSGGRGHTGQDLVAATGTPLVAIEAGRVYQTNWHWAGGNQLYILGDSGGLWLYAHLASPASVSTGSRVEAGQRVGAVGSTGNASIPHLHIGWYPGGSFSGALSNPYSILRSVCG